MKALSIKQYPTNTIIFVSENGENIGSFTIDFDGLEFFTREELEDYIKEKIEENVNVNEVDNFSGWATLDAFVSSVAIPYQHLIINYKNDFKQFLKDNLKKDFENINFEAYCEDLEEQYYNNGFRHYELSKFESKSGKPEIFDY